MQMKVIVLEVEGPPLIFPQATNTEIEALFSAVKRQKTH